MLTVITDGPHMNACGVVVTQVGTTIIVDFTVCPKSSVHLAWFYFRVDVADAKADTLRFELRHLDSLFPVGGVRPVARVDDGTWARIEGVSIVDDADYQRRAVWELPMPQKSVDVALDFPYTHNDLDELLARTGTYWKTDAIGTSHGGNPLVRLSNFYSRPGADFPGIYVLGRQHGGEHPASWVLHGFLRDIAVSEVSRALVWAVPFADLDGALHGDHGKFNLNVDLNRTWYPLPKGFASRHETVVYQRDIARWAGVCRPAFALDFHAPSLVHRPYVTVYVPEDMRADYLALAALMEALNAACPTPIELAVINPTLDGIEGTFSHYSWGHLRIPALVIEVPYGELAGFAATRSDYEAAGAGLARGLLRTLSGVSGHIE